MVPSEFVLTPVPCIKSYQRYTLPIMDDILPGLVKVRVFSTVDCRSGFWYCSLDHDSSLLTTVITPFARYCWLHLWTECLIAQNLPEEGHSSLGGTEGCSMHSWWPSCVWRWWARPRSALEGTTGKMPTEDNPSKLGQISIQNERDWVHGSLIVSPKVAWNRKSWRWDNLLTWL